MNDEADTVHAHHCRRCDGTWHCNDPEHQEPGTSALICKGCKHSHFCRRCGDWYSCEGINLGCRYFDFAVHGECQICRALPRFAAFIEAIRDLLRWLDVANKLELGSVVLRSNVHQAIARHGCDCECEWHGGAQFHDDACDGTCDPCTVHDVERVLNRHFDTELTLRLEGEALLAKGVGR